MFAMPPRLSTTRVASRGEQRGVQRGQQRRALAAGSDVGAAEIGDRRDARALGDHRRIADLQRERMRRRRDGDGSSGRASRSRATSFGSTPAFAAAACAASAKACADRDIERAVIVQAIAAFVVAQRQISARAMRSGYGVVRAAMTSRRGSKRTSAASMPSALVPEMSPR